MSNVRPAPTTLKPISLDILGIEHEKTDAKYLQELQATGLNQTELSAFLLVSRPTIKNWIDKEASKDFAAPAYSLKLAQAGDFVIRSALLYALDNETIGRALKTIITVNENRSDQRYSTEAYRIFPYAPNETKEALQPALVTLSND